MSDNPKTDFDRVAQEQADVGFVREFLLFLHHNKKWWLLPIILILFLLGLLVILSGSAAAPFIYTFF
jgi:hypothetical protein